MHCTIFKFIKMNREKLQTLASEWVRVAKNDIRKKVMDFMREVDTTPRELAYALAISEGELEQIIRGNGEITLSTFAKLLIATGNALEIKPIEETPIGDYENIPSEEEIQRHVPRPNVFDRQRPPMPPHPRFTHPTHTHVPYQFEFPPIDDEDDLVDDFENEFEDEVEEQPTRRPQPRDEHGRFMSNRHPQPNVFERPRPTSPFSRMSRDEMKKIIEERLWDSEIDVNRVSDEQLVRFLEEKDKRMKEYKRMRDIENDPSVVAFKNKLKNTVDNNPHLREWVKKFVGGLNE